MMYLNNKCADTGTVNCPCPLALTGDCLVCSRLAGSDKCDCSWSGVCIYNEFMQNGCIIRDVRKNTVVPVHRKKYYGEDLLYMELEVPKGFALQAMQPGAFIFVKPEGEHDFYNMPVSVMKADAEKGMLHIAVKIISGKSKKIAEARDSLEVRGVYRNGLLGKGTRYLESDRRDGARWLIITKGIGFAPAVKLIAWAGDKVWIDLMMDTDKINEEFAEESITELKNNRNLSIRKCDLQNEMSSFSAKSMEKYDRVIVLTSNYYINKFAEMAEDNKFVYCNNFNMCCGEGICGACCYTDNEGNVYKKCKCRT